MKQPRWLTRRMVDLLHDLTLRDHGGLPGVRDENALESALARPQNRWVYEPDTCDLITLAAAYGYGFTTAHAYSDGNKRIGFLSMLVRRPPDGRRGGRDQDHAEPGRQPLR